MLIRILTRKSPKNPKSVGRVTKLLNPLRTQIRAVRFGTPPDYEDGLVEVRNRRLGSVILSYHELVALMGASLSGVADRLVALEEFWGGGVGQLNPPRRSRINPA